MPMTHSPLFRFTRFALCVAATFVAAHSANAQTADEAVEPDPTTETTPANSQAQAAPAVAAAEAPQSALAQSVRERSMRAYVPPDELVSFLPSTSMREFIRLINPVFARVTGKRVVDPLDRTESIEVSFNGVHFIDAFEAVLDRKGLDFRETESYFVLTEPTLNTAAGEAATAGAASPADEDLSNLPATADSREVRIDAVIFELNSSRAKEVGTNWGALFGQAASSAGGQSGGGQSGGGTGNQEEIPRFFVEAGSFFESLDGFLEASSERIEVGFLLRLFRWFEDRGYGQTIASPSVTVQSGIQGRIQSGEDVPVVTRDFAGNPQVSYVSTGTIIDVMPTLITDPRGSEDLEFVHIDVKVEKSTSRPFNGQAAVLKNDINTQLTMLSGEQRAIGGLTSQEETITKKGVPILKDIPLLSYLFSYESTQITQKELVIVLQATILDDLHTRKGTLGRENGKQLEGYRDQVRESLNRFNEGAGDRFDNPETLQPVEIDPEDV